MRSGLNHIVLGSLLPNSGTAVHFSDQHPTYLANLRTDRIAGYAGDGVRIAIVDSGINLESLSPSEAASSKNFVHRGKQSLLYYWRDAAGHEIDVIIDMGTRLIPIEAKSAQTVASDFFSSITYWRELSGDADAPAALIYGGDQAFKRSGVSVYPWFAL